MAVRIEGRTLQEYQRDREAAQSTSGSTGGSFISPTSILTSNLTNQVRALNTSTGRQALLGHKAATAEGGLAEVTGRSLTAVPSGDSTVFVPTTAYNPETGRGYFSGEPIQPPTTISEPRRDRDTTTSTPQEPQAPVTPGTPSSGASAALAGFTEAEIEAALAALEAEFGMTREQLLGDQSMLGAQYRLLAARLTRQRTQAVAGATNDAVSRGIYRSGVLGENLQNIETQFAETQQAQETERLAREQEIQQRLAFLEAEKQALMAQTEAGILRSTADIRRQAAGV